MSETSRKATMVEAKQAWDDFPENERSIRKVVAAMKQNGLSCHPSTLQRWKDADWLTGHMQRRSRNEQTKRAKSETKKADKASAKVSETLAAQEGKLTRLEIIEAEEAEMKLEREKLLSDSVLDSDLARIAMRESLIAQIVIARQITRRASVLLETQPEIAAKLIDALKAPAASTTIVIPPADRPEPNGNGDDARVVNGRVLPEKSASQLAIESFKNRRSHEVAA
jgi:hypothetical protein